MRAIVVGAGDVGYDVARLLSLQRHDVTVIDTDPGKVEHVRDTLDVLAVVGSGTSATALRAARIADADLLVAVTDIDEVNLIASMLAERVGKSSADTTTIARRALGRVYSGRTRCSGSTTSASTTSSTPSSRRPTR